MKLPRQTTMTVRTLGAQNRLPVEMVRVLRTAGADVPTLSIQARRGFEGFQPSKVPLKWPGDSGTQGALGRHKAEEDGCTPLYIAAQEGHIEVARGR